MRRKRREWAMEMPWWQENNSGKVKENKISEAQTEVIFVYTQGSMRKTWPCRMFSFIWERHVPLVASTIKRLRLPLEALVFSWGEGQVLFSFFKAVCVIVSAWGCQWASPRQGHFEANSTFKRTNVLLLDFMPTQNWPCHTPFKNMSCLPSAPRIKSCPIWPSKRGTSLSFLLSFFHSTPFSPFQVHYTQPFVVP